MPTSRGELVKEGADTFLVWNDSPTEESVTQCMRVVRGDATLSAPLGRARGAQEGMVLTGFLRFTLAALRTKLFSFPFISFLSFI